MPTPAQWNAARARARLQAAWRARLAEWGYLEVETPCLVPVPGMEPHIDPFEVPYVPGLGGQARTLALHTSPEYAMKRLLADGSPPLFQLCKVFRNGELARGHNPEFTMLEFYRPHADYTVLMAELEALVAAGARAVGGDGFFERLPYERLTVRDALLTRTGVDLRLHDTAPALRREALARGLDPGQSLQFDDTFFTLFLTHVEPTLGQERPTFLMEYPASMASLARLKPGDSTVAERVELYARGVELANGFSELTDAVEQRARLLAEQAQRRAAGRPAFPLDEAFLEAVGRLPPCTGVALGVDRLLALLLGAEELADVLLFPARGFLSTPG